MIAPANNIKIPQESSTGIRAYEQFVRCKSKDLRLPHSWATAVAYGGRGHTRLPALGNFIPLFPARLNNKKPLPAHDRKQDIFGGRYTCLAGRYSYVSDSAAPLQSMSSLLFATTPVYPHRSPFIALESRESGLRTNPWRIRATPILDKLGKNAYGDAGELVLPVGTEWSASIFRM